MRFFAGIVASALLTAFAGAAEDGCSKDTDCKGERICQQRQCVDASAATPAGTKPDAAPASYQPGPVHPAQPPASTSGAPTARPFDTYRRHFGFFIRPDFGVGYLYLNTSSNGTDASIKGVAGGFGVAVGAALSENNILAFHIWDLVATNPTFSSGGFSSSNANATLGVFAFGPEYTRYFADNFYFSITPSLSRVTLDFNGSSGDTNWGFGLRAGLGKEWWVSDHWGLGVAGHLTFTANQDSGSNAPTWTGWGGTVAFSATYN
jgi:hypothetical protein